MRHAREMLRSTFRDMEREAYGIEKLSVVISREFEAGCAAWIECKMDITVGIERSAS